MTKAAFLKKLGSNITRIRTEKGITQVERALRCGKDKQVINRIETGILTTEADWLRSGLLVK